MLLTFRDELDDFSSLKMRENVKREERQKKISENNTRVIERKIPACFVLSLLCFGFEQWWSLCEEINSAKKKRNLGLRESVLDPKIWRGSLFWCLE